MSSDDRSWLMRSVMSMDQAASVPYFYPRLFPLVCITIDHFHFDVTRAKVSGSCSKDRAQCRAIAGSA